MNLAQDSATRRHHWGTPNVIAGAACADGCDRNERACLRCGLVKITMIPPQGLPWRAWRTRDGLSWQGDATPPCLPAEGGEDCAPAPDPARPGAQP